MSKKKNYTFFWLLVNVACWLIIVVMVRDIIVRSQQEPEKHYIAEKIAIENNKYGDYLVGLLAKQNRDYGTMIDSFERALKQDPDNLKLKKNVYLLKAIRGDIADIIPIAEDLNTLQQAELLTDYVLAADKIKQKSYADAARILAEKPNYGADKILKPTLNAWIFVGQNNRAEAEKSLEVLNDPKSESLYHYYMALVALAFDDKVSAEKSFHKMNELSSNGYPSLTTVAFLRDFYTAQDKWKPGIPEYDRCQHLLESSISVKEIIKGLTAPKKVTPAVGAAISFYDISVALSPLKLEETSLLLNALAIYLNPEETTFKIWAGELLEMSGNHQAANHIYQRIENKNDVILMKMVINLVTSGEYQKSLQPLYALAEHNPDDAYIQMLLGDSLFQTKNYKKSIESYQKAANFFQGTKNNVAAGQAYLMLGSAYDNIGDLEKAEEKLLTALRLTPNNPEALNYLGYLWLDARKNIDEAFEMVQKAAQIRPGDPNIMDSLALGYYLKKDYKKALELAEQSTDKLSYSSVAYAHLGDIYAALNRMQEAHYQYRKALDLTADITPKLKSELEEKLNLTR